MCDDDDDDDEEEEEERKKEKRHDCNTACHVNGLASWVGSDGVEVPIG